MSRVRRIAEEEVFLVLLLAVFGVIILRVFPPHLLVTDSWLLLAGGREVVHDGLPSLDEWAVLTEGRTWTDQQWGAQVLAYGAQALGGHPLLVVVTTGLVLGAFAVAAAGARSLGAGPRAVALVLFPVVAAAPWAWTIRAQVYALPLFTGLVWLLASQARRPSPRVYLVFPMLLVWANLHGSVALGALLVMLLGAIEVLSSQRSPFRRSVLLLAVPPLLVLGTPYGPVRTAQYYHLLLVDPPFDRNVTEWQWSDPDWNTLGFYVLAAAALVVIATRWRRMRAFDLAALALTLVGAVTAIRGIPWFALSCMVLLPPAIGYALRDRPAPFKGVNRALSIGASVALVAVAVVALVRDEAWYERKWPDAEVARIVEDAAAPDGHAYAATRFGDWLLWKAPGLRGRIAYDVRFEILDPETFEHIVRFRGEQGDDWKALANGYRVVVLESGANPSSVQDFLSEPGARLLHRDDDVTVVLRLTGP